MEADVAQGVAYEINAFMRPGWQLKEFDEYFVVIPSRDDVRSADFEAQLKDEVWSLTRLLAYSNFVSISKRANGGYEVKSNMESGGGFVVRFEPN